MKLNVFLNVYGNRSFVGILKEEGKRKRNWDSVTLSLTFIFPRSSFCFFQNFLTFTVDF